MKKLVDILKKTFSMKEMDRNINTICRNANNELNSYCTIEYNINNK